MIHGLGDGCGVGWQENDLDGLEGAVDVGIGSGVIEDEGDLPLHLAKDPVLLVKPGAEDIASHPGSPVCMEVHWQLMHVDPHLAEDVWFPAVTILVLEGKGIAML